MRDFSIDHEARREAAYEHSLGLRVLAAEEEGAAESTVLQAAMLKTLHGKEAFMFGFDAAVAEYRAGRGPG